MSLALSGKANDLFTAEEIIDLKLNADSVVMSACNTGRGQITEDGIIGRSRSWISAGVSSGTSVLVASAIYSYLDDQFLLKYAKRPRFGSSATSGNTSGDETKPSS